MPEFLSLLPPVQARALLFQQLPTAALPVMEIDARAALGRITAEPVLASEPLPGFDRSTVDGFAVRAVDTYGASDTLPAYLGLAGEVPMGMSPQISLGPGQAALIHTGGMLPAGADAVVMLEMTQSSRPGEIELLKAVASGENILRTGEDVAVGTEVLPAGTRLRPAEIGGLMALGQTRVKVVCRPRIAILSSGDEVISPEQSPQPGQVRDINSYTLAALVEQEGGQAVLFGILGDRREVLQTAMRKALDECDAVVITAGSSASTRDLTAEVIQTMGRPGVLVHGVNVKPGKPTILAVCDGKAVIGLPGNPVSALVIAGIFVVPVVHHLLGLRHERLRPVVTARLLVNLASQAGREDWVPVHLRQAADGWQADPIFYKSNLIFSLARADGLVHIPADANGLEVGSVVEVEIL
jgi:molybdopterin molybdotransferase